MAPGKTSQAIVHTWSDSSCGTGESYHQTQDGRIWKEAFFSGPPKTGETRGVIQSDGRIRQTR